MRPGEVAIEVAIKQHKRSRHRMPSEERPLKKLKREKSPGNPGKLKKLKSSSRRKRDDSSDSSDASRPREHVAAERAFTKVAMDAVVELKSQIERGTIAKRETDLEDPHIERERYNA